MTQAGILDLETGVSPAHVGLEPGRLSPLGLAFVADETAMVETMPHVINDPFTPPSGEIILLVEDEPTIRDVVRELFECEGLIVTAVVDGREAVAWAERHRPALVVLDIDLPHLDGVAVATRLRARYGMLLPIVIFSADYAAHARTRHLKPCGLVPKPFDADALLSAVRRGLDGGRNGTSSEEPRSKRAANHQHPGDDMLTEDGTLGHDGAELRSRLAAGALAGRGPVMLHAGPFADAELAGRVLLADLMHLSELAEHTGQPPTPERWALLADDVRLLLQHTRHRRNGAANGYEEHPPPSS
jgi:CheY-like chemotaxis protein